LKNRKVVWISVLLVVVVLGALVGFRAVSVSARLSREAAAAYATAKVTRASLEVAVAGTGTLAAEVRQDCVVTAGGKVLSVLVEPGQTVKAGQTLVILSNESLADQVEQARLEFRLAQMDLDGMTKPGGGLATAADLAAAQAAVDNARLAADRAQDNVDHLTVRAPFDGRVSGLGAEIGDDVAAGTTLLAVASADRLKALLSVPESEIKHVAIGEEVTVTVSPLGRDLRGHVSAIGAQGTAGERGGTFYQITVALDDADPLARGGMSVKSDLDTGGSWPSDTITVAGVLAYAHFEPLVTATGGLVTSVSVSEDEIVSWDQVLMTLVSDQAQAALTSARAELARAAEKLTQLTDPGPSSYPLAQLEKQKLRVAEAALRLGGLERQLDDLTVKADFDGTVTEVAVSVGERAPPNMRVAALANLSRVRAIVTVDELEVAELAVGQASVVRIDALPGETFVGVLESMSLEGVLRDGVTSYEARVAFDGDARMRTGMSLSVSIQVARRENALVVPAEAVYGAGKEASVQVLVDGKPEARPVVAGLSNDTYTEIVEGLVEGETVVTGSLETNTNPFGPQSGHPSGVPGGSSGGMGSGGGE